MRVDTETLAGLREPGSITIDRWGIPHIEAMNEADLFFLQGYNAARDRLWQIDLWRKRGLGLLAADFGPGYLTQDRAARLFLYRGDMTAEWAAYSDDAEAIATAFVAGINAYVDHVERHPEALPPEFTRFGTRPARWQAEDVVRIRSHSLMRNALSEVIRANVMAGASADVDRLRQNLDPPTDPVVPEGIDLAEIPLAVLDVFKLALAAVTFDAARLAATPAEAEAWTKVAGTGDVVRDAAAQGSNNWVIHGSRTDTGRPIMANDPHRTHAVPSLRYLVHLTAPGLDVIGAGEPCLPGISIGHNGTAAFGLTLFFGPDQEDVYVYETAPDDPDLYRYGDGWERMTTREERAAVAGYGEETLRLKFTRHGPVVYEDRARRRAFAIRSVWFDAGTAPYFASIASMRARSFQEFRAAMARWGVPATNQVYADTSGTIAWLPAGFSPVRPNWDGLLPVPGDGRYEWRGYFPADELPVVVDPPAGHFATANEQNMPADWPHAEKQIGYEWLERSRANRIAEVLGAAGPHTVATSGALQADTVSLPARRLTALLGGIAGDDAALARARDVFAEWDHRLGPASGPAMLFEVWWAKHLRPALFARVTDDPAIRALLAPGDPESVLALIERPDGRLGADPAAARDALLVESLTGALAECTAAMGDDPAGWRWGDLHRAYFAHATSALDGGAAMPAGDVGPLAKGGSDSTPMNASYRTTDFRVTLGASVRVVVDVGGWDDSLCINAPGQSGDPASPHYGDLAEIWARGDFVPLLYSKARVAEAAERRIDVRPA